MTTSAPIGPSRTATLTPPGWPPVALARVKLETKLFFRQRDQLVFSFLYPLAMLLIFGSVFGGEEASPGVSFSQYFVAGIAATGIMLTSFQSLGISIAVERDQGDLARLRTTPMPTVAYFIGKAGMVLVSTALQLALLLILARVAFDVPFPVDAAHWVTFAWIALLGSVSGSILGFLVSSLPRSGKSASSVIAPIALVLQFFSGVFFVYASLPGWMQQVAALFPLKWLTQGMRSVFLPADAAAAEVTGGWEHGRTALVLIAWTVIGLVLASRTFRWRRAQ
ncbi:MAG: ABC transporter permease [Nakamurella sp.]